MVNVFTFDEQSLKAVIRPIEGMSTQFPSQNGCIYIHSMLLYTEILTIEKLMARASIELGLHHKPTQLYSQICST